MLPAERELKDMLQVSRGTLREAFRVLEQKGLIDIKLGMGGGAVIKDPSFEPVSESLARLIRHQKVSLAHLAEFRGEVEGAVAALAALRADRQDVRNLESLLQTARDRASQGGVKSQEFLEADKEIHLKLAEISGNPIYHFVHLSVHDNIGRYYERYLTMNDDEMAENFQDLEKIIQAVKEGQAEEARKLAKAHVHRFSRYMEGSLSPGPL
jgi:DNA-binding FadR family transcriptional regulator